MRFLSMVKHTEGKSSPPSKSMMEALGQLLQELAKEGCVMVQSGGLFPTNAGARVRLAGGKVTVTDGPFTEAKEVVGGYAIFDVPSKAHMISVSEHAISTIWFLLGANGALGTDAWSITRAMVVCRSPAALVSLSRLTNMS